MIESISRDRLIELLEAGANQRIAIIGDAMLDVYLRGDVDRISPEAPVPVVRVRDRELALGGAANVAQNVAAIGADCDLVCAVGEDAEGQVIKTMLRDIGSEARSVVTIGRRTTTKTRVLARSQQVVRFDEEEDADISGDEVVGLIEAAIRAIDNADAVVREVYDVVGAGDTVTAYLATMLAAGATAAEAAVIANFAAGVEVAKLGAATVSIDEVIEAYDLFGAAGTADAPTA